MSAADENELPGYVSEVPLANPKFLDTENPPSEDYSSYRTDEASPIFSKRKMVLRIPAEFQGRDIVHLTVSKNWLFCILREPTNEQTMLLRFFLPRAIPPAEVPLDKYLIGYRITRLFVDFTGHHLLLPLVPRSPGLPADFLYMHGSGPKIKRLERFKDYEITAVAFNMYAGTETATGPMLLGTSKGLIFETELTQEAERPLYRKQVYDLGLGRSKYPITSLELLYMTSTKKHVVLAATLDGVYTFQEVLKPEEKPSLQSIFVPYVNGLRAPLVKEEKLELNNSVLRCFAQPNEKHPTHWGWLCGAGIRTGELSDGSGKEELVLLGDDLISLDFEQMSHLSYEERRRVLPKTFVLTEYHALLLYPDHVTAICLLNHAVVYEEYFAEQLGQLLNIVRDAFTGNIYLYTEKGIFSYKITLEDRNIWEIHLQRGNYDMAELYAAENPAQLDVVRCKKAEVAFVDKKYELAAQIYAVTCKPFEEVCLKFMVLEDKRPVIKYVKTRLDKLRDTDATQTALLVMWLIDLYLTQINLAMGQTSEQRQWWQRQYEEFMAQPRVKNCVRNNYKLVFDLVAKHADAHNLSQLAVANDDYEAVVEQHLSSKNYVSALEALGAQTDPELFYKYCPTLMQEVPHGTVELLKKQRRHLQMDRLMPTLIAIETPQHVAEIMKYLEYVIYNLDESDMAVHNFLLRLYAEHKPDKLIAYLENEGRDVSLVHYDVNYALSVCLEYEAKVASVFLQCLLELWTAAVELALSFNVQLAKETASKPKEEELRRKLWLTIAHQEIKGTNDVKKALALLKECHLLRIEDLLPLFSDFERIDDFKEPICQALKEYNEKIQELQQEMEESSRQAERVRNDLQTLHNKCVRIEAKALCAICDTYLLLKPFFVFPCAHKFHSDCLEKQLLPTLSTDKSRKLTMLKQQLDSLVTQSVAMAGQTARTPQTERKRIKQEVEDILAADCLFCGHMIEAIDQPFCEDWDQVTVDWS